MRTTERPTLEEILERYRRGDRTAREEFFTLLVTDKRYRSALFAMARGALRGGGQIRRLLDSHDLVQSTVGTAIDKFPEFRGEDAAVFFSWMRTILRSKIHRAARQESQRLDPRRLEPTRFSLDDEARHGLAVTVEDRQACDDLYDAIAKLPPDDRRIVELRLTGMTSREIGGMMTLKPAAVRKRLSRTIHRLKSVLVESPGVRSAPAVFAAARSVPSLSAS